MKSFEASGRTVEDAISAGLAEHGLSIGDVSVEILEEGSKGLFGLFGSREARVRLTMNAGNDHADTMDLFKDSLATRPERRPEPARPAQPAPREERAKRAPEPEKEAPKPREAKPRAEREPREPKEPREKAPKAPRARKPREARPETEDRPAPQPREERVLTALYEVDPASPAGLAQDFLKELTGLMGLDISVSVALDQEGHVFATLDGDPQGILIGRRGETLDALQYLTSLKVNKGREEYIRVTIDSEGYRQKREEALIRLANRMANRARKTGRRVSMEPMNPYERRIFHSALQASPGIATHSEGEEPNRHIVITPVKERGSAEG